MFADCQHWRKTVQGVGIDRIYSQTDPFDVGSNIRFSVRFHSDPFSTQNGKPSLSFGQCGFTRCVRKQINIHSEAQRLCRQTRYLQHDVVWRQAKHRDSKDGPSTCRSLEKWTYPSFTKFAHQNDIGRRY